MPDLQQSSPSAGINLLERFESNLVPLGSDPGNTLELRVSQLEGVMDLHKKQMEEQQSMQQILQQIVLKFQARAESVEARLSSLEAKPSTGLEVAAASIPERQVPPIMTDLDDDVNTRLKEVSAALAEIDKNSRIELDTRFPARVPESEDDVKDSKVMISANPASNSETVKAQSGDKGSTIVDSDVAIDAEMIGVGMTGDLMEEDLTIPEEGGAALPKGVQDVIQTMGANSKIMPSEVGTEMNETRRDPSGQSVQSVQSVSSPKSPTRKILRSLVAGRQNGGLHVQQVQRKDEHLTFQQQAREVREVQRSQSMFTQCSEKSEKSGFYEGVSERLSEKVEMQSEYQLKESLWDAALVMCTKPMPSSVSFSVALCLLLTICFTIVSLGTSRELVLDKGFNEHTRAEFNVWRTTIAHDVHLRDRMSGQSLARSVCEKSGAIVYSTLQVEAKWAIDHYIGDEYPRGEVMCILALCIWYLSLMLELKSIAKVSRAFSNLPVQQHTIFLPDPDDNSISPKMRLVSISVRRVIFVIFVSLLRLAIVVLLGLIGTQYLCLEDSPEDMLLNSVALEVILNFDELLYVALLPQTAQSATQRIMPLTFTLRQQQWRIVNRLMWTLVFFAAVLCTADFTILRSFVEELRLNERALCGGLPNSLDFVMAVDSIGIPWVAATPSKSSESTTYSSNAISHVKTHGLAQDQLSVTERSNKGYVMQIATGFALESLTGTGQMFQYPKDWQVISQEDVFGIVGWDEIGVLKDQDFGDATGTVYNHYLKFLLGSSGPGTVNCSHVPLERCYVHGSHLQEVVMRQLCPSRCGCDSPNSGSVSTPLGVSSRFGFVGCGSTNLRKANFVKTLGQLPCHDTKSSDVFASWVQGVGNAPSQNSSLGRLSDELMAMFQHGGCPEVVKADIGTGSYAVICDESSLPSVCPESCGCIIGREWAVTDAGRKIYCPYSCEAEWPPCMTIGLHDNQVAFTGDRYLGAGYACKFPFIYEGKTYHNCTKADWVGLWCAITTRNGEWVDYWGDCPSVAACGVNVR